MDYQSALEAAFPPSTDAMVMLGVKQGVGLAHATMDAEPYLQTLVGKDVVGQLRRAAVLYRLHELCKSGDLPFAASMTKMPKGGAHWVELTSGNFRAHICRTDGPLAFPTDTPTRQDQRLSNQLDLFANNVVSLSSLPAFSQAYAWLNFGASGKNITHLCWAMPKASKDEWLARVNVIQRLGSTSAADMEPLAPSPAMQLNFKQHIAESLESAKEGTHLASQKK